MFDPDLRARALLHIWSKQKSSIPVHVALFLRVQMFKVWYLAGWLFEWEGH